MKVMWKKIEEVGAVSLCIIMLIASISITAVGITRQMPSMSGKMVYHSYTSYESKDSKLYLYDFDSQEKVCLSDKFKNVYNAMNANFNNNGTEITFMGMNKDKGYEKWDVYTYNLKTEVLRNLTENNDLRNEDPKYSPDGKKIVFKQGHWDHKKDKMIYDLMEIDLENGTEGNITKDSEEDSMPYYSEDGQYVFYSRKNKSSEQIYKVSTSNYEERERVYSASKITSYYPIIQGNTLYFTRWYSKSNHSDIIMSMNLETEEVEKLKFNNERYNCSDPCPIDQRYMILSSTKAGGRYKLYLADMNKGTMWPLDKGYTDIDDNGEQLGASCYIDSIR